MHTGFTALNTTFEDTGRNKNMSCIFNTFYANQYSKFF